MTVKVTHEQFSYLVITFVLLFLVAPIAVALRMVLQKHSVGSGHGNDAAEDDLEEDDVDHSTIVFPPPDSQEKIKEEELQNAVDNLL